ncbi:hypothetical protein M3Y97_00640400 [Aphelenchoides bicaudatus]|nr:hypothetical protein M3Y97_00640400 [Aphelenchoides bicaudatus]
MSRNDSKNINNVQLNATLISKNKMNHQPILNIEKDAKTQILSDFVQNIKESIFGPDNLFLKVMFCGEVELTEKLFNLCGLETVIALRQTCKKIYRKSNSAFLDAHYWKKQFSQRHLPKKTSKDPNPYRKALFKKLRDQDRAAYFESVLAKARQEAMNFYRPNAEIADPLRVPPPNFPRNNPYGIANFDPVRNFDENFYGQEVFRSRHPNPNMPNAPRIDPHFHDDPRPRRRPDPDMPQGPFGNPNRFI